MANHSIGQGECPLPFLQLSNFPYTGGFEAGRLCTPIPLPQGLVECCLPCPLTEWVYPAKFPYLSRVANWLNVGSIICVVLLLLSFLVLPVEKTRRHYLTVCMIIGVGLMSLSFIIPLGSKPSQCQDAITPNDMFSDLSCAFSGSFILAGGFAVVTWVFLRALSLHLQICWQMIPGRNFLLGALLVGWGVPVVSLALVLSLTGVSYRFGTTCHINHDKSVGTYWAPLLAFAGAAMILQFVTLGYCIRVYIRSFFQSDETSNESGMLSYHGSSRTAATARATYRRVSKVIAMQWRGMMIVLIIIVDVVFLAEIFIKMDNDIKNQSKNMSKIAPWISCLVESGGDKNACLNRASTLLVNEATVLAVLILLSLNGFWCLFFLGRWQMIPSWIDLLRKQLDRSHEFVSRDARRLSDPRNYEMLTSPPQSYQPKSADDLITSPVAGIRSPESVSISNQKDDYFGVDATYINPSRSFSRPKPPGRSASGASERGNFGDRHHAASPQGPNWPGLDRTASLSQRDRGASALALDRIGSPTGQARSDSALSRHRAGSSLGTVGRDWDPHSTYARPTVSPQPHGRSSAQGKGYPSGRSGSAQRFQWEP